VPTNKAGLTPCKQNTSSGRKTHTPAAKLGTTHRRWATVCHLGHTTNTILKHSLTPPGPLHGQLQTPLSLLPAQNKEWHSRPSLYLNYVPPARQTLFRTIWVTVLASNWLVPLIRLMIGLTHLNILISSNAIGHQRMGQIQLWHAVHTQLWHAEHHKI